MKTLLLVFICFTSTLSVSAQFGDANKEVQNLRNLAKVWGFIKYHHPDVQTCFLKWDMVLLKSLENLDGANQSDYTQQPPTKK